MAACAYFWLVRDFVQKKRTAWLTGGAYLAGMLVMKYIPYNVPNFWAYLAGVSAGLLAMCLMERRNLLQKIFLAETFYAIRWLMMMTEASIGALIFKAVTYFFRGSTLDLRRDYILYLTTSSVDILIGTGLMFSAVWLIRRTYRDKARNMQGREFMLMSVPSLAAMMGYANYKYMDDALVNLKFSTYDAPLFYHGLFLLYCMSFYITIVIVIVLFQNIKEKQQEETQKELLAGQMEDMKRHIREVEELYQEIRSLKHDMGNHVMVMQSLAGREQEQYAESLKAQYSAVAEGIQSGNPVTDVILMERSREARSEGIAFECGFRYPAGRDVDAFDLSIILNNALANAIEAARREDSTQSAAADRKFIKITSSLRGNVYIIEVENSYSHKIFMDRESNLPVTTKEDKVFHGFGLRNIRRVAQKYHGDIAVEASEVFRLSVMLQACEL